MKRESMKKLRLDRRLIRRRGWIRAEELERELEALPDASHKIAPSEEEPSQAADEAEAQPEHP